jgi:hypothetical protein
MSPLRSIIRGALGKSPVAHRSSETQSAIIPYLRFYPDGMLMMSDKPPPAPRFLVRQGSKGWMVYDRERKAPALVGTNPAVNLTKEQADQIELRLAAEWARKQITARAH